MAGAAWLTWFMWFRRLSATATGAALILVLAACAPAANESAEGIWAEDVLGVGGGILAAGQTTGAAGPAEQAGATVSAMVPGTYFVSIVCVGTGDVTFTVTSSGTTLNRQYVICDRQPRKIIVQLNGGGASVRVSSVQPGQYWAVRLESAAPAIP